MYNKKSNILAGFSLFLLLALVITGCTGSSVAAAQATTVAPAPTTPATAMPAPAMPTSTTAAMSTAMPVTASSAMPTTAGMAATASSSATQTEVAMLPTATTFTLLVGTNSTLGDYLTDDDGQSLYVFANDTSTTSNCNGACATLWPPLIGSGVAASGVTGSMIGVVTRQDGNDQVTYNGHPLYYFKKDVNQGDVNGQGVGGKWWLIAPNGVPITKMLNAMPATPAAPASMMTATP